MSAVALIHLYLLIFANSSPDKIFPTPSIFCLKSPKLDVKLDGLIPDWLVAWAIWATAPIHELNKTTDTTATPKIAIFFSFFTPYLIKYTFCNFSIKNLLFQQ